ncbi:FIG00613342: Bacterial patatin-like phospholipase domain containing protein [hydrothermal vent metagenome]|uniref:FIG00613342: Bacterial patatin-like phospholipase domain containing protein n=1 Tax=hydrothermal vent metagenome TaxID=652676 RepID=A0A3B1BZZ8_9ZZZZ
MNSNGKTVSLVLGSGGARGFAHVGVIEWLLDNGYDIRSIAGSSMGALVGGIYAAGELQIFKQWILALTRTDVIRFLDFSFSSEGLFKGERIISVLKELVGEHNIEDLPVNFTAVASDIERQKEIWLSDGPLFDAIRASIAVPTIFTPHEYRGLRLLDGGLLNPVPVMPTLRDQNDLTIAVNLNASNNRHQQVNAEVPENEERQDSHNPYQQRILDFIESMQRSMKKNGSGRLNMLELVSSSFETMQNALSTIKIAAAPPDVLIEIPRSASRAFEFHRGKSLIKLGYDKTALEMERWQAMDRPEKR